MANPILSIFERGKTTETGASRESTPGQQVSKEPKAQAQLTRQVTDPPFMDLLDDLVATKLFLYEAGVVFEAYHYGILDLSELQTLQRKSEGGRSATAVEWARVNEAMAAFATYQTPELYRQKRMLHTRRMIGSLPLYLLCGSILGVIVALLPGFWLGLGSVLPLLAGYLIWTISLGGLGAAAFLAVNSLSVRNDANFDLADSTLVQTRLVLGAVFGFVLGLPVSLPGFTQFIFSLLVAAKPQNEKLDATIVAQILLPFFLGFSTSLVLTILDRFVSSASALFGVNNAPPPPPQVIVRPSPALAPPLPVRPGDQPPPEPPPSSATVADPVPPLAGEVPAGQPTNPEAQTPPLGQTPERSR